MCKIIEIDQTNVDYLKKFLLNNLPDTFRYFNKRSIDVINNHLLTILLLHDDIPVGYAHIDFDNEKYWFGICLLENYQNMGYGKQMMEYIFKKVNDVDVYLTVDKININAVHLYKKFNFKIINDTNTYYLMKLQQIVDHNGIH